MASDRLGRIYPSGFLGSNAMEVTDEPRQQPPRHRLFDGVESDSYACPVTGMRQVDRLYQQAARDIDGFLSFDFREKVMLCALQAFGTNSFSQWVYAQMKSTHYSDYHQLWIVETLRYVIEGKKRSFTHDTWASLLMNSRAEVRPAEEEIRRLLSLNNGGLSDMKLDTFLRMWVQKPKGCDDLLSSLHVLFGTHVH